MRVTGSFQTTTFQGRSRRTWSFWPVPVSLTASSLVALTGHYGSALHRGWHRPHSAPAVEAAASANLTGMHGAQPALADRSRTRLGWARHRVLGMGIGLGLAAALAGCASGPISTPDGSVGCSVTV